MPNMLTHTDAPQIVFASAREAAEYVLAELNRQGYEYGPEAVDEFTRQLEDQARELIAKAVASERVVRHVQEALMPQLARIVKRSAKIHGRRAGIEVHE